MKLSAFSILAARLAVVIFVALAAAFVAEIPSHAQSLAPDTMRIVEQARGLAGGDPADIDAAMERIEAGLESLPPDQNADRYALAATGGQIARAGGDHERAQLLFATAAAAVGMFDGQADLQAGALEAQAGELGALERFDEARATYEQAREIRDANGVAATSSAVLGATARLQLARRTQSTDELTAALSQLTTGMSRLADIQPFAQLAAFNALAAIQRDFGNYDGMLAYAQISGMVLQQAQSQRDLNAASNQGGADLTCPQEEAARRELAGVLIGAGEFDRAESALSSSTFRESCADFIDTRETRYLDTLMARLALDAGLPLVAEARLADFAGTEDVADLPPQDAAIIDARLAATYTQLGFLGRAARYFQDDSVMGKLADPEQRIEYLIAWSLHDFLSGDSASSLEQLTTAEKLAERERPRDWYLRARVVFRRALLLIDAGRFDEARAARAAFETYYTEVTRDLPAIQKPIEETPQAQPRLEAFRRLYDLLLATATSDADAIPARLEALTGAGWPTLPGLEYFAQRAYLEACFSARDAERCAPDAAMTFSLPYNVPFGIPTLLASQSVPNLSGDMFRFGPLRARLYGPLTQRLWQSAEEARADWLEKFPEDTDFARDLAASAGADTAFMLAQLMVEGAAETTARQVAERLAASDTRLGTLLRRRDHLSDEIERGRLGRLNGSAGDSSPNADIAALNDVQQDDRDRVSGLLGAIPRQAHEPIRSRQVAAARGSGGADPYFRGGDRRLRRRRQELALAPIGHRKGRDDADRRAPA